MNKKTIFSILIAAIFIAAMILYHDTMSLEAIILAFTSAIGANGWVRNWFSKREVERAFREQTGMKYSTYIEKI